MHSCTDNAEFPSRFPLKEKAVWHPGILVILAVFLASAAMVDADIPGLMAGDPIDLSPGADAYALQWLQLNHSTHKLYVSGWPSQNTRNLGLKVIDTISGSVLAGIDLGRYTGDPNWFTPLGFAIDESAAPVGNKIYMVGKANVVNARLRVIDGESDTNLTGEGTDLFLPVDFGNESFESMAVNSANHKVYIVKYNGDVVVIDGPGRKVLTTLHPDAGNFIIANPGANKVFVVNHNGGALIDSGNDTFTQLALPFVAFDAVLNPANGWIYFSGAVQSGNYGVFAVDGNTGQLITSRTGLLETPKSVTFVDTDNTVRVGTEMFPTGAMNLLAFDGKDLSPQGTLAQSAFKLAYDPMATNGLLLLSNYQRPDDLQNSVGALNPSTETMHRIATGYRPFEVAVNSRTNRVYVTDEQTREILVIDGTTDAVVSRIPVLPSRNEGDPLLDPVKRHVAVSERLNRIYLPRTAEDSNAQYIDVFDGGTNQLRGSIVLDTTIGYYSSVLSVDDTRRRIYVAAFRQNGVSYNDIETILVAYDTDNETPIATVSVESSVVGASVSALIANPVTGRVYISTNFGVAIVDGNTDVKVVTIESVREQIAINRRTNKIYTQSDGGLAVINGATDSLETTFPIEGNSDLLVGLDVDEVTNRIYVVHAAADDLTGRLAAYDANNNYQLLGQIDLDLKPAGIAVAGSTRRLFVSNDLDGAISIFQDKTAAPRDLFGNISTRAHVGNDEDALIGGFILDGSPAEMKRLLIRAVGPSLRESGVADALGDTTLEVHDVSGNVTSNDNWKVNDDTGASQQAEIEATGIPPSHDLESALLMTLPAGQSVTAIVRGEGGTTGIGLVEVYDLESGTPAKLANISTRGQVGSGDDVMIGGVIVLGTRSSQVLFRAIGPSLATSGVVGALEDPVLELHDPNGGLVASNDDWREHEAEINATSLPPPDPRESAILVDLFPANYTAIVRGKDGAAGVALVEAYYLNQ